MASRGRSDAKPLVAMRLALGDTIVDAAAACAVSERTVTRWQADATFRALVASARSAAVDQIVGRLVATGVKSIERLAELRDDGGAAHRTKLDAAYRLLLLLVPLRTHEELDRRLRELEEFRAACTAAGGVAAPCPVPPATPAPPEGGEP